MSASQASALVVDPCEELVAGLGRIEDRFLFTDPETDEQEIVLRAGARAAGELTLALRRSAERAPALYGPGGAELVPIYLVQADLEAALGTLRRGLDVAADPALGPSSARAVDLLARAAKASRTAEAGVLAALVGSGRGQVRLGTAQYRAYVGFVRAVLIDPLDRFIAIPPPSCPTGSPVGPAAPEVEL